MLQTTESIVEAADRYHAAGLTCLPAITAERRTANGLRWNRGVMPELLSDEEHAKIWRTDGHGKAHGRERGGACDGCCILGGTRSGNLECLDFDRKAALYNEWATRIPEELGQRLVMERSQRGGVHVIYRCESPVDRSLRLAWIPKEGATDLSDPSQYDIAIETRGDGGLFICSPSPGYAVRQGDIADPPTITAQERQLLLAAAKELDQRPAPDPTTVATFEGEGSGASVSLPPGSSPGHVFNAQIADGDDEALEILRDALMDAGWVCLGLRGDPDGSVNEDWKRPDKEEGNKSATLYLGGANAYSGANPTGVKRGTWYVFSSNAAGFDADSEHSPFHAYAVVKYGGDTRAAARDLGERGYEAEGVSESFWQGGARDANGRLILRVNHTGPSARAFLDACYTYDGSPALWNYDGRMYEWRRSHYAEVHDEVIKKQLQAWLEGAWQRDSRGNVIPFAANPTSTNAVATTLKQYVRLEGDVEPPTWLDDVEVDDTDDDLYLPDPGNMLAFPSGLLDVTTGRTLEHTPALFNFNAIDFDYDPGALVPSRWLSFLEELWGDDIESIELLQEWLGYNLMPDNSQQKMLLMVGPTRSGKGTIARVMRQLIGKRNCTGLSISNLCRQFGLQSLLGKSAAIVSEAKFAGKDIASAVADLLSISGNDTVTIDRKFMDPVDTTLQTRFTFLTNELPRVNDASKALAGRFMILRMTESFYGREDHRLTERLTAELPGVLKWALEGLRRLRERGYFVQPASSDDMVCELEDMGSPVSAFVDERCVVGPEHSVSKSELYKAWVEWCVANGNKATNLSHFSRDLYAAFPHVTSSRPRDARGERVYAYGGIGLRTGNTTLY